MVENLKAEGKEVAGCYTHKNPEPKMVGEEHMRQMTIDESAGMARQAGSEGSAAGGPAEQEEPVDQEESIPTQFGVEEEQQVVPSFGLLMSMPEALMEVESAVPVISLPDIDLPQFSNGQEEDILAEILRDESCQASMEFPEEAQVVAATGVPSELLTCMQDIRAEAQQPLDYVEHGY